MPYHIPEMAHTPYQPSNGTEGAMFQSEFCDKCVKDEGYRNNTAPGCPIIANAMTFHTDQPEYPAEWTHDDDGCPTCTAFMPLSDPAP